jgi:hypothetical protein
MDLDKEKECNFTPSISLTLKTYSHGKLKPNPFRG